jgi:hypothetical protein
VPVCFRLQCLIFSVRNRKELPTIDAVRDEAAHSLADMARDEVPLSGNGPARHMAIEVRDGDSPVMHARFSFENKRLH